MPSDHWTERERGSGPWLPWLAVLSSASVAIVTPLIAAGPKWTPPLECRAIAGLSEVAKAGNLVFFGEIHGTEEAPAFVADAACTASRWGRVHVGLELPQSEEAALRGFLAGEGDAGLRAAPFWRKPYQDGRSSRGMLALLKRLREYRRRGAPIEVFLFDHPERPAPAQREEAMAENIERERQRAPADLYFVEVGNYHARRVAGAPWDPAVRWLASILASRAPGLVALDLRGAAGTAWVCSGDAPDTCGIRPIANIPNVDATSVANVVTLGSRAGGAYDGTFSVGTLTASPPAFPPTQQAAPQSAPPEKSIE